MYPSYSFYIYLIFFSSQPPPPLCSFNYPYLQLLSHYTLFPSQPLPFFPYSLFLPSLSTPLLSLLHPPSSAQLILYFSFSLQFLNKAYCLTPILYSLSFILTSPCHNFFSPRPFKKKTLFPFQLIHSPSLLTLHYSIKLYLNVDSFFFFFYISRSTLFQIISSLFCLLPYHSILYRRSLNYPQTYASFSLLSWIKMRVKYGKLYNTPVQSVPGYLF